MSWEWWARRAAWVTAYLARPVRLGSVGRNPAHVILVLLDHPLGSVLDAHQLRQQLLVVGDAQPLGDSPQDLALRVELGLRRTPVPVLVFFRPEAA